MSRDRTRVSVKVRKRVGLLIVSKFRTVRTVRIVSEINKVK